MQKTRPRPHAQAREPRDEAPAAREIGCCLREAREARRERLDDIADYLRIRPAYLAALEEGEFERIPGRPYLVGFLRSYGGYLGIDGEALVTSLKSSIERATPRPELTYREPIAERRRGTAVMVTASLLLAVTVYSGYYVIYHVDRSTVEAVIEAPAGEATGPSAAATPPGRDAASATIDLAALPPPLPAASTGSAASAQGPRAVPTAVTASPPIPALVAADDEAEGGDAGSAFAAEPRPAEIARHPNPTAASAAPAPAAELLRQLDSDRAAVPMGGAARAHGAVVAGEPSGRLTLLALDSSWVQIRSANHDYVRTRTLEAGERLVIPNRNDLTLWTGNGGSLELLVDGQSRGPLGQTGEVVKNLPLLPDTLRPHGLR